MKLKYFMRFTSRSFSIEAVCASSFSGFPLPSSKEFFILCCLRLCNRFVDSSMISSVSIDFLLLSFNSTGALTVQVESAITFVKHIATFEKFAYDTVKWQNK